MTGYSVKSGDDDTPIVTHVPGGATATVQTIERWLPNADFIADARSDIPALCDALEAAWGRARAWKRVAKEKQRFLRAGQALYCAALDERDAALERVRVLEEALREAIRAFEQTHINNCIEAYTSRDLHAPECLQYEADDARAALGDKKETP
jgi:hypothetical protein